MQEPLYNIESEDIAKEDFLSSRLVMVVDPKFVAYLILNPADMQLKCIRYFDFAKGGEDLPEEIIREIIFDDGYLSKETKDVFIVYNFPESQLVPEVFFDAALVKEYLDLGHGNFDKSILLNEKVPWWEIYNLYRLPVNVHKILQYKFPQAKIWHSHSLLLKSNKKFISPDGSDMLKLLFYNQRMILSIWKKGQLQLLRSIDFVEPADVLWNLLNCCRQLNINEKEAVLIVGGFIKSGDGVYQELKNSFPNILFDDPNGSIANNGLLKDYPLHYFSTFLKMAACVS